jgi:hypothetical protein
MIVSLDSGRHGMTLMNELGRNVKRMLGQHVFHYQAGYNY